jgi:hypothetical protein
MRFTKIEEIYQKKILPVEKGIQTFVLAALTNIELKSSSIGKTYHQLTFIDDSKNKK